MGDPVEPQFPEFPELTQQEAIDLIPAAGEFCRLMLYAVPGFADADTKRTSAIARRLCSRVLEYARTGRTQ